MDISHFLGNIDKYILNPIIVLLFAIAFLIFVYGIFQFINSETSDDNREGGKKKILYGLIGMFVMFSAYGLIRLVLSTFNLQSQVPSNLQGKI